MKILICIIIFCGSLFPQKYLRINFSEAMNTSTLEETDNYKIFDDLLNEITITGIAIIEGVDSIIFLKIPSLNYKTNYIVRVENLKDKSGNVINPDSNYAWFYFDGFNPEAEVPETFLQKK